MMHSIQFSRQQHLRVFCCVVLCCVISTLIYYVPVNIVSNCEISEFFPCKNGRLSNNSAKIHPTLQISAAEEYSYDPSNNSGGLYHNVIACGDNRVFGVPYIRARPKSANFIVPSLRKSLLCD